MTLLQVLGFGIMIWNAPSAVFWNGDEAEVRFTPGVLFVAGALLAFLGVP